MTGPTVPPSDSPAPRPDANAAANRLPSDRELLASRPSMVPGTLGRVSIGRMALYVVGVIAVLFMAKAILYKDPTREMTDDLYRIGATEATYRATHPAFTTSLSELQQVDRKARLHSQLVQFDAGRDGYQIVVRHANTDAQCTLIAGSFKPLGGNPEVTCVKVPAPK